MSEQETKQQVLQELKKKDFIKYDSSWEIKRLQDTLNTAIILEKVINIDFPFSLHVTDSEYKYDIANGTKMELPPNSSIRPKEQHGALDNRFPNITFLNELDSNYFLGIKGDSLICFDKKTNKEYDLNITISLLFPNTLLLPYSNRDSWILIVYKHYKCLVIHSNGTINDINKGEIGHIRNVTYENKSYVLSPYIRNLFMDYIPNVISDMIRSCFPS